MKSSTTSFGRQVAAISPCLGTVLLFTLFLFSSPVYAATITVTSGGDTGSGTLRNAISSASSGDVIVFSGVSTVTLTSNELAIDKNLTIDGGTNGVVITRSGSTPFRIFKIELSRTVSMNKLTIHNGNGESSNEPLHQGGGIQNYGTLTMTNCTITGNTAPQSGGIQNDYILTMTNCTITGNSSTGSSFGHGGAISSYNAAISTTLTNCTISGNSASIAGGALFATSNGTIVMTNCTVTNNTAPQGSGLHLSGPNLTLKNTIVADNGNQDINGTVNSASSYNLIGTGGSGGLTNGVNNNQVGVANPGLGNLANNGGPTQTHALMTCSPAVNNGTNSGAPSTDQRGSSRPYNSGITDIGAYELQSTPPSINITSIVSHVCGSSTGSINLTVSGGTSPYTYAWSGFGSGTDPRTNLGAGTYTVTVTDNAGCTGTHSATVTNQTPTTANAGANQTGASTCGLTQVTLSANTPSVGTGAWSVESGGSGTFSNPFSPTSTFSGTAGSTYSLLWTISSGSCQASVDNVLVTFNRNPTTANAGTDQTSSATCGLTQVNLAANIPAIGSGAWSVVSGTGGSFGSTSSPTSTFVGTTGSAYTLRWTISNSPCAASTDEVNVTFNASPTMSCPSNMTVEEDDPAFILSGATPAGGTYSGTGVSNGMFNPTTAGVGVYTITYSYTNATGCSGSCSFTITVRSICVVAGATWYVDAGAASGGTGSSWICAFQNLQDAINAASSGHEIWVKSGTYKPTKDLFGNAAPTDSRDKTFYLKGGVAVYGGFAGTETARGQRNWTSNVTTLSGDIGTAGNASDNAYHVLVSVNDGNTTVVDGFSISDGNASFNSGSYTVESNTVFTHTGGGLYCQSASPTVSNCSFSLNSSLNTGGGMYNGDGSPILTNCIFRGNSAGSNGAGMCNNGTGSPQLINCLFSGNSANNGGGMYNASAGTTPVLINCTISGNKATTSCGGVHNNNQANPTLKNCIIWNNREGTTTGSASANLAASPAPVISYSLIQNQTPAGTGNLEGITNGANSNYPAFVTPLDPATAPSTAGDFHIGNCSPVVNLGTNTGAPTTDLFGNTRPYNSGVADMGVHELQAARPLPSITCPANQTATTPYSLADFTGLATASGTCTPVTVTQSPSIGTNMAAGTYTVTLTATAGNGATATCTFTLTVNQGCSGGGTVWYVSSTAPGGGNGSSWPCAFQNLQDAIDAASSGQEIWVKSGTYLPTKDPFGNASPANARDKTFYLKNGVAVYGGFAGTETARSQRNWTNNVTILSGDIGTVNDDADNCYHVVLSVSDAAATVLDGFTVSGGAATGTSGDITVETKTIARNNGGGMHFNSSSPTLANCVFSGNSAIFGGGIYQASSAPTVTNCRFSENTVFDTGGGVYLAQSSAPTFNQCIFAGNSSSASGAGFYVTDSGPALTNCLISGNSASVIGGGMMNTNSTITLTNCTLTGNKSGTGSGGIRATGSAQTLKNCLIWNNRSGSTTGSASANFNDNGAPAITYSLIQNQNPSGTGNLNGITNAANSNYPAFVTPLDPATAPSTAGDFHLTTCSPVLNLGTNTGAPSTDLFGNARPFATTVDMGVHELQSASAAPTTANAGADQTGASTCGLTQVTLAANPPAVGTGAWSIVSGTGGSFGNASSATSTFTGSAGTAYVLRWTISNASCTASTDDVSVTFNRNPTTANAGADQTGAATCGLTTVTLAATTPTVGTGMWTKISGTGGSFGNASSPTSTFSGTAGVAYVLRWTISNDPCTASSDDVNVTFNQNPTTSNAGADQTGSATCGLTTVTLAGNTPAVGTGMWSIVSGTGGSFGNANSSTSTFFGTAGFGYQLRWTISNAPCTASTDNVNVTFNVNPTMSCPTNFTVNDNTPAFALTGATPAGGTYSGTGVSGGMFNPATAGFGTHTITYSYANGAGCSGSCNFTISVVSSCPATGTVWYVNPAAASGGNGASWACAFQNVQDAIDAASSGHEVWVKAGTHIPTKDPFGNASPSDPRDKTFYLKNGVALYGGFAGTETARSQRNWTSNVTILSGDIGTAGVSTDNCYHVVLSMSDANTTVLDGFIVEKGNASLTTVVIVETQPVPRNYGGGLMFIVSSPTLANNTISNNNAEVGGGNYNGIASNPALTNCVFSGNAAIQAGGGMYNSSSAPALTNCLFSGNKGINGGGVTEFNSNSTLINCTFSGNWVTNNGGAISLSNSNSTLKNCLIWNNRAGTTTGSAIASLFMNASTPVITYSLIQNQAPVGAGNLNGIPNAALSNYPDFVTPLDPATAPSLAGDFHLAACSPVLDKGNDADNVTTTDLDGQTRKVDNFPGGSLIDLGAYEFQGTPTPVVAICQNITVQLDGAGNGTLSANSLDNSSTGCAALTFSASQTSFTCSNLGPNTVTLTVTGSNGSTGTCTSTVTVADLVLPNALCRDLVKNLDATGSVAITKEEVNNLSNDNCGTVNLVSVTPGAFTCSNIGMNTVTLTVNDGHGNTNTCNATVTVSDQLPPTAVCQNISVNLNGSGTASITAAQINNGSSDNCGIASVTVEPSAFTCSNVGNQTVTLTVTDVNNLASTCSAVVTVTDPLDPTAICQNVSVNLGAGGTASVAASQVNNGSSDNCGIASLSLSTTSFTCANVGANPVTLTVTDNNSRTSTCTATITVTDATNPTAVCQNITLNLDGSGNASITGAQVDGGSSDNCGIASRSVTPNTFTTSNIGPNTVTLTVTDNNSRTATCTAIVTVTNTNLPNAVCQPYTAVLGANGSVTITPANVNGGSTAVGGIASMDVSPNTLNCANIGTNTVVLTVLGNNGLTATCNATVTVQDNTVPTVVCQNISVNLSGNSANITASQVLNAAASSDNCGTVNAASVSPNTFNCGNLGANTVTLTANDGHNNVATCSAVVTVNDATAPTAICQNVSVNLNSAGTASVGAAQVNNGSSDNCGTVNLVSLTPSTFSCAQVGPNTVTLTVNDGHGNSANCTATVTVADNLAPSALCRDIVVQLDGSGNATITAAQVNNGSSDNCTLGTLSVSPSTFTLANLGVNTVTLTVPDTHGNSSTCTAQVTVENNQLPNAVCQNITRNLSANGTVALTAADVDGGSTALGGIASRNVLPNTLNCSNIGANTVSLTIIGNNGQQASCNATVTVNDNLAPTAACQNVSINLSAAGTSSVTVAQVNNGSSDNCGMVNLVGVSPNSFTCSNLGSNTVTLTVNDGHGNSSTCTAIVMVADQLAPTATCQNVSVNLSAAGTASVTMAQVNNGSSDNCGTVNLVSVTPSSFTCSNLGANTVTLTVNDGHGNSSSCTAIVMVVDQLAPTAVCQNVSVNLSGSTASVTAAQVNNSSSDNCGMVNLVGVSPNSFTCSNIGANTVTLTVNDGHGNSSTCTAIVMVADPLVPIAVCQNVSVNLNVGGTVSVTAAQVNNGSSDNCGTVNLVSVTPSSFTCSNLGANTVTLLVNDGHGNTASCTATVTVSDPNSYCCAAPQALCQATSVVLNGNGQATIQTSAINNGSTYECGLQNMTVTPSTATCANIGALTVTLTVTDVANRTSNCTAIVMVADQLAPAPVCQNISVNLSGSTAAITASQVLNAAASSDNCGMVNPASVVPNSFNCNNLGANTVVLTVNDGHGNTATCTAVVTVADQLAPTATCQNVSVNLSAAGTASVTMAQVNNGSSDNCGTVNLVSVTPNSFTCSNLGTNTVTLTVNDGHGNSSTCTAIVMVADQQAPTATCQNVSVNLSAAGTASVTTTQVNNGSSDNCGTVNLVSVTPNTFTCSNLGSNTVTLTVNDGHGNSAACTAIVTVADQLTPTATCQNVSVNLSAAGTASVTATQVNNGSSDNCGTVNLVSVTPNSFTCSNLGANTVTLMVNDGHSNTASCTAVVTVTDQLAPTATCQNVSVNLSVAGTASVTATQVNNGSSDNCGTVNLVSVTPNSFTCSQVGANTVTLTVNDSHGNTAACTAIVMVADQLAPTATCKPATLQIPVGLTATLSVTAVDNNSTDNCGIASRSLSATSFNCNNLGANTVVLTVTDVNGLSSTCSATVTVTDPNSYCCAAPVAICKPATVPLNSSGAASISVAAVNNNSTYDCGLLSMMVSPNAVSCANIGANTVTLTVTDVNNHSSQCTATVTVTDPILPSIVCPSNLTRNTDANQCTAMVTYASPTFSDNCSGATLTRTSGPASGSQFAKGTTMVNWRATDASGNSSVCGFTVTVNDNQAPTITCPANQTKNVDAGQCTAVVTYVTPLATDNCTGASAAIYSGLASGVAFPKGANAVVWQATDGSGLTSRCTFMITVNDNQAPVITCPGNQTKSTDAGLCTAVVTYTTPTFTDNCTGGSATLQSGLASGLSFPKGITTVVWRATDAAGLTKTCSFKVTINDSEAPAITCPANQSKTTDANVCSAVATYNLATFTDNCTGGTVIKLSGLNSGAAFPKGTNQVVFKATDASGNQTLCTMTVTVTDAQLPTVTCPANIAVTGTITNGVCSATVNYTSPAASDNCALQSSFLWSGLASGSVFPAGVTTNVWKATDEGGLTATCVFTVTVGCATNSSSVSPEAREVRSSKFEMPTIEHGYSVNMTLVPNPATTEVQITLEGLTESGGQLTVFDAQGRVVWQQLNILDPITGIDVSGLPSGLYQVRLQTENGVVAKGMVVSRL